jgi:hypothetical protein
VCSFIEDARDDVALVSEVFVDSVQLSYAMAPAPMSLDFWPGAVSMMLVATLTATLVTFGGAASGC